MAQANPTQAIANIYRTPELWEKIVFTFICLVVYRVGSHVAAPGVDVQAMVDFFQNQSKGGGLLGLYDLFVGGNLSRATVFALGIMPYISASIFAQIAGAVIPQVDKMQKDEEGRKQITQWTRYGAVGLAMVTDWRADGDWTVEIAGTQYPNCIRATVMDAACLDYDVTVVTDACSAQTDAVAQANIADMAAIGVRCLPAAQFLSTPG